MAKFTQRNRLQRNNVVIQPLHALKLGPDDTLIIHFDKKPTEEQLIELRKQLTIESWGSPLDYRVLYGPFKTLSTNAASTQNPTSG